MSLRTFQSALVQLIANPDFRDSVVANGADALGEALTEKERARLCHIARDPGMDINRKLHKGFRLGKLRALLPLTCQLLGPLRLAREVAVFWQERPPASFSFLPEALEFCDFLVRRKLRVKYLEEVTAYESAVLTLEQAKAGAPSTKTVQFHHDPGGLLSALAAGKQPRGIARRECEVTGHRDARGPVQWTLRASP